MPLVVGNLLQDPAANSFISLSDAVAYLTDEASGALPDAALGIWMTSAESDQESSLVRASRWMAGALFWCKRDLDAADFLRVGQIAARLAVSAITVDLYEAAQPASMKKRVKAGSVEVEYMDAQQATQAAGRTWPWLMPMLRGLVCDPRIGFAAFVV